ncbi:hypothetical protein [Catellatospora vulcania]|uniref:hypothetical protein n=1 Tax=Catellatospora vulcania TaxID=1460450 RepID=UPI0012D394C6|nr:hypothetical protein [Catellatospora vulcania]
MLLVTVRRALPLLGVLTAGLLVSAVAGTSLLNQDLQLVGFFGGLFVALGAIYVIKARDLRAGWGFTALGLAVFINIIFMLSVSAVILELAGEPVAATVVADRDGYEGKAPTSHRYTLTELGGAPIRGELTLEEGEPLELGEQVTVLRDPAGLANPMLADEVVAGSTGALVFFWLVLAVPALIAGVPRREPAPPVDPDAMVSPVFEVPRGRRRDRPRQDWRS